MQGSNLELFDSVEGDSTGNTNLLPCDGELYYLSSALPIDKADQLLSALTLSLNWRQDRAKIMGRLIDLPRLTAWYGDRGYRYSGIDNPPQAWSHELLELKRYAEQHAEQSFNTMLANLYRDGRDSMGWHSDEEKTLGINPVIASISLGASRRFHVKHRRDKALRLNLELEHGSCLIMAGSMQHHWQHHVPKTKKFVEPRINLTFRMIIDDQDDGATM